MRNTRGWVYILALFVLLPCGVRLGAQPVMAMAGTESGGGNPFKAPPALIRSYFDFEAINPVSKRLEEFLAQNDNLPGSVKPENLGFESALAHLKAGIVVEKNSGFLTVVRQNPQLQSVHALQGAAILFFARNQRAQALTCLFVAQEKAPKDSLTLVNLASAALIFRQANEALALLDEVKRLGPAPAGAGGLSGSSTGDYLRGYAFMLRGQYADAKKLLAGVVEREPFLTEAALTLALIEAKLGEKPRQAFLLGVWRQRGQLVVRDHQSPPKKGKAMPTTPDPFVGGEDIGPDMSDLFDLSMGQPGTLPPVEVPTTAEALHACWTPFIKTFSEASNESNRLNNLSGPEELAFYRLRGKYSREYHSRMERLYNRANVRRGVLRELNRAVELRETLKVELDTLTKNLDDQADKDDLALHQKWFQIRKGRESEAQIAADDKAEKKDRADHAEIFLKQWSPLTRRYLKAVEDEYRIRGSYMSGMLSHIGEPNLHRALELKFKALPLEYHSERLHPLISIGKIYGLTSGEGPPNPLTSGEPGIFPPCSDAAAKWSHSVEVGAIEMEMSCDNVSFELKSLNAGFISLSTEVAFDSSGAVSLFVGPKFEPKADVPGLHEFSAGGSFKDGLFLTVDGNGIRDAGAKIEVKASATAGQWGTTSYKADEMTFSVMPSPSPPPAPGPLPNFKGAIP